MAVDNEHGLMVALKHPVRREILRQMNGMPKVSPRELASTLDMQLSNVSYHVRVLSEQEAVELVGEEPVRGSMQHFYRLDIDEPWALAALGISPNGGVGNEGV